MAEHVPASTVVIARHVYRGARRPAALWAVVFSVYVAASVSGFVAAYGTVAARQAFAASLGTNAGFQALFGPAHRLDTAPGFTAWRCLGVCTIVGAIWGLLTATKWLRGEEDAGRWELLLSGQTTRGRGALQAMAGLADAWLALFAVTAVLLVADGRTSDAHWSVASGVFFALALTSSAAMFLAIGALASQLAATRRQASMVATAVLGAGYLLRMVADSGSGLAWLRWLTPLGWPEELRPLTGSHWTALIPIGVAIGAVASAAVWLAAGRDLGASTLPDRSSAPARTALLNGPGGLTFRLNRSVAAAWLVGIGIMGLVFGLVAQSAASAVSGSASVSKALARLGGSRFGAAAYLGLAFLFVFTLTSLVAAGQVTATREEEAEGRLDNLLVRPVGRWRWLLDRVASSAALVVVCGVAAGVLTWVGAASQHTGVGFGRLLLAGLNAAPPALFVLGVGTLAHAAWPRYTSATVYGLIAWSFLIELVGSLVKMSPLVLDSSVFYHVTPAPAADPNWTSGAVLVALGAAAVAAGGVVFHRRDLASA